MILISFFYIKMILNQLVLRSYSLTPKIGLSVFGIKITRHL